MNICLAEKNDASQIAKIHKEEIKKGFLSSLNNSFLVKFYEAIMDSEYGFCILYKQEKTVVGFVSGVTEIDSFYKYFLKNYFFSSVFALLSINFNFNIAKKIVENVFYPKKTKNFPSAELLTMAVKKDFQGRGAGSQLLQKFIEEMKSRQIKIFKVLVGKKMIAADFYKKNGFELIEEIRLHDNETSLVLAYKIS